MSPARLPYHVCSSTSEDSDHPAKVSRRAVSDTMTRVAAAVSDTGTRGCVRNTGTRVGGCVRNTGTRGCPQCVGTGTRVPAVGGIDTTCPEKLQ